MIHLPLCPSAYSGGTRLAAYLAAEPSRAQVVSGILANLDPGGLVGDNARYHIVRNGYRRAVFRGVLDCLGLPCPVWALENAIAAGANKAFVHRHRDKFNAQRREARKLRRSNAALNDQISHNQREAMCPQSPQG